MELRSMLCFVTAAKLGSFTRAAKELFISQPALSQSIRRLEEELGVALFRRGNNTVELTRAGQVFLPEADSLLARSRLLKERMTELSRDSTEPLNFGISTFYSRYFLPDILNLIARSYPMVRINCVEDVSAKLEEMVMSGILDCCVVPLPCAVPEAEITCVRTEEIYLAFPSEHPLTEVYAPDTPVPLEAVADEAFVFLKPQQRFSALGMKLCADAGFTPDIVYETMNWETVDAIVAHGMGIGFVPDILACRAPFPGQAVYRKIAGDCARRSYALIKRPGNGYSLTVTALMAALPQVFRKGS